MDLAMAGATAFAASLLTFFSGFGLGTILTPVFILFFPIELAVAMTAIVHLLNNVFKLTLIGGHLKLKIAFRFGGPAILGAFMGALVLAHLSEFDYSISYDLAGETIRVTSLQVVIGLLILFFSLFEILPVLKKIEFRETWLTAGGLLSGFLGGLSGHQGALRSAFLIKFDLSKEQFIATGVTIACFVDLIRISIYAKHFAWDALQEGATTIIVATLCAFGGAILGKWLLGKTTIKSIQYIIGTLMAILGIGMIAGVI